MPRTSANANPKGRGRPREFAMAEVLDKAAQVFCERGYHATSIGDLTSAMGLASGSVYKAFKDKRAVFMAVFERYRAVRGVALRPLIEANKPGRERIRDVLAFYAEAAQGEQGARGCLVTGSAVELSTLDPELTRQVAEALAKNEAQMIDLIRQGQEDGSVSPGVDSVSTARLMLCLVQGMRVVGKTRRTRDEMLAVVDIAMKVLG